MSNLKDFIGSGGDLFEGSLSMPPLVPIIGPGEGDKIVGGFCRPEVFGDLYDVYYIEAHYDDIVAFIDTSHTIAWQIVPSDINANATAFLSGMYWDVSATTFEGGEDEIHICAIQSDTRVWIASINIETGAITQIANYGTTIIAPIAATTSWFGQNLDGTFGATGTGRQPTVMEFASDWSLSHSYETESPNMYPEIKVDEGRYIGNVSVADCYFSMVLYAKSLVTDRVDAYRQRVFITPLLNIFSSGVVSTRFYRHGSQIIVSCNHQKGAWELTAGTEFLIALHKLYCNNGQ